MSKRDAIIISVLVNAGILAILFVTAIKSDPEQYPMGAEIEKTFDGKSVETTEEVIAEAPLAPPIDEVDTVLQDYLPDLTKQAPLVSESPEEEENTAVLPPAVQNSPSQENYIEVTVKRGDALEKIARSNGTTVEAIKSANQLKSDRLKIGQVLRIPQGSETKEIKGKSKPVAAAGPAAASSDIQYYTIKSGDNPWKIAKQFNVKFDDLLRLNNLDAEKAKNLKIGDKIRVK